MLVWIAKRPLKRIHPLHVSWRRPKRRQLTTRWQGHRDWLTGLFLGFLLDALSAAIEPPVSQRKTIRSKKTKQTRTTSAIHRG
jgi:hypothetical protein